MRFILFIIISVFMISIASCSTSDNSVLPPSSKNLSGLEGEWTVILEFSEHLTTSTGTYEMSYSGTGIWTVTSLP